MSQLKFRASKAHDQATKRPNIISCRVLLNARLLLQLPTHCGRLMRPRRLRSSRNCCRGAGRQPSERAHCHRRQESQRLLRQSSGRGARAGQRGEGAMEVLRLDGDINWEEENEEYKTKSQCTEQSPTLKRTKQSPKRLYKAPTDQPRPQNIRQGLQIFNKSSN